ncbi:hypothetical protein NE850_25940 [Paraburkholderia sp. USG1]|uniref:hypothetical protein n=1 Tax=Paraburkholderia sp. USG1 TaxID=2952268 RepID=UPI002860CD68|nr:hypothetical protein [Paraburkholderia sp. USG1]MDR8399753.1 hypothetical protein [Paraburkholderia sp. USG1]
MSTTQDIICRSKLKPHREVRFLHLFFHFLIAIPNIQVATGLGLVTLTGCSTYYSLQVFTEDKKAEVTEKKPILRYAPVLETDDYSVYAQESDSTKYYLIPNHLDVLDLGENEAFALAMERQDQKHLIFTAVIGPDQMMISDAIKLLAAKGIANPNLVVYPLGNLIIRPLTNPRDPNALRVTAIARSIGFKTQVALLVLQTNGKNDVRDVIQLLDSKSGVILEGGFTTLKAHDHRVEIDHITLQIRLHDLDVSNLSK